MHLMASEGVVVLAGGSELVVDKESGCMIGLKE